MLIWTAALFVSAAALFLFAWPLALATPGQRLANLRTPAARTLASGAATLLMGVILAPLVGAALISGADTVQFVATEFGYMSFGI